MRSGQGKSHSHVTSKHEIWRTFRHRTFRYWTFRHMDISSHGHLVTRTIGHKDIWSQNIWSHRHSVTRTFLHRDISTQHIVTLGPFVDLWVLPAAAWCPGSYTQHNFQISSIKLSTSNTEFTDSPLSFLIFWPYRVLFPTHLRCWTLWLMSSKNRNFRNLFPECARGKSL